MLKLLLVVSKNGTLSKLESILNDYDDIELSYAESGETALGMLSEKEIDLVVTDEELSDMTGLEFAQRLITQSPMTNCVAISSLSEKDFHEASEGLGLMSHLPVHPDNEAVEKLMENLRYIKGYTS